MWSFITNSWVRNTPTDETPSYLFLCFLEERVSLSFFWGFCFLIFIFIKDTPIGPHHKCVPSELIDLRSLFLGKYSLVSRFRRNSDPVEGPDQYPSIQTISLNCPTPPLFHPKPGSSWQFYLILRPFSGVSVSSNNPSRKEGIWEGLVLKTTLSMSPPSRPFFSL